MSPPRGLLIDCGLEQMWMASWMWSRCGWPPECGADVDGLLNAPQSPILTPALKLSHSVYHMVRGGHMFIENRLIVGVCGFLPLTVTDHRGRDICYQMSVTLSLLGQQQQHEPWHFQPPNDQGRGWGLRGPTNWWGTRGCHNSSSLTLRKVAAIVAETVRYILYLQ